MLKKPGKIRKKKTRQVYMNETLFPLPDSKQPEAKQGKGKPRIEIANRQQVSLRMASLDELIPEDHRARIVWEMAQKYDLSSFYEAIDAIEGEAGRPAIDPRLLLSVWLYGTLEGVGSARALARLCQEHLVYQWLLGGVSVNYHTLADFRVLHESQLDQILTHSVAALMKEGWVDLEQTAQDGVRIRASAGGNSFHRKETLGDCLERAEKRVQQLKEEREKEGEEQPGLREKDSRERHARERLERVEQALKEVQKIAEQKAKNRETRRKERPARASTTDPEARIMKMPDGGFRPAYNAQLNVDMKSRIIVGVEISNEMDTHLLEPMLEQTRKRYGQLMKEHYVDGGFRSNTGITAAGEQGVQVYSPIPGSYNKNSTKKPEEVLPSDSPQVAEWKRRMVTEEAKEKYQGRASTVEWANALLRNRNLKQFVVRTSVKVRSVLLWYVLAHNLIQTVQLRLQFQGALG
jgi:transposase